MKKPPRLPLLPSSCVATVYYDIRERAKVVNDKKVSLVGEMKDYRDRFVKEVDHSVCENLSRKACFFLFEPLVCDSYE